nr:hypothetical protein Itr_chr15CG04050 [Ipomoea trifida]
MDQQISLITSKITTQLHQDFIFLPYSLHYTHCLHPSLQYFPLYHLKIQSFEIEQKMDQQISLITSKITALPE